MNLALENATRGSVRATCSALGVAKSTFYRRQAKVRIIGPAPSRKQAHYRRLPDADRLVVFTRLCSLEFRDLAPPQVYALLLHRGEHLCSVSTMYRILHENKAVCERRPLRNHPKNAMPVLSASGINQLWSWDITKIPGPIRGVLFSLYVVLDVFSRHVVAWHLDEAESAKTAERVIRFACVKHGVNADELTLHADRGAPMTSRTLAVMMEDLGITKSHSRPRVSDDNPYSEAQFKTLKYHRDFPPRMESIHEGQLFLDGLFHWYNHDHFHKGIAYFTPAQVYSGEHVALQPARQAVLDARYAKNPERFVNGKPIAKMPPDIVGINLPKNAFPVSVTGQVKLDNMPSQTPIPANAG
jgi:putative transposase